MKKYNIGILGATGAVGQEMMKILAERSFPVGELRLLASRNSAGKEINGHVVVEACRENFEGLDIILGAAENDIAERFVDDIKASGAVFIDNSSAFRLCPDVPLVVPEINPEDVKKHKGVIANPNCTTVISCTAVNALNAKFTPNANPYYGAPTILLVLVPRTFPLGDLDGAAVLTNLCNGAYAAGLASCWINRPQFMFETNEGREMLKRWGVDGDWRGVGSVAVGHPAAPDPEAKPRKVNYCYIVK